MNAMLLGIAVALAAPGLKEAPKKGTDIMGGWIDDTLILGGKKIPATIGGGVSSRHFNKDGKYSTQVDGMEVGVSRGFKIDSTTTPWTIDLIDESPPPGGRKKDSSVWRGIFKIEGDQLTLCMGPPTGERPTKFESPNKSGMMLWTLKRAKPKE